MFFFMKASSFCSRLLNCGAKLSPAVFYVGGAFGKNIGLTKLCEALFCVYDAGGSFGVVLSEVSNTEILDFNFEFDDNFD